ncbi:MAG: Gfo/Idh/MocA family oxidoreductase [Desulfurococcaceae archaeon]
MSSGLNKLRVGFIGAGFSAKFHARAFTMIRDAEITAVYSRTEESAKNLAALIESLGLRKPKTYTDLFDMLRYKELDAVWILLPNNLHLEATKAVVEEVTQGRSNVIGVTVEKPLARNSNEANKMVELVEKTGLLHGYLENQVFMPSVSKGKEIVWNIGAKYSGRPYLARAAEEHGGPHSAWFWKPSISGGGVLLDMGCHSIEASRELLLKPGGDKSHLKPKYVYGEIAFLKWIKETYAEELRKKFGVDFLKEPAEDYSLTIVTYEDPDGALVVTEARTSWAFIGAGLRLTFEVLGPEYSLSINTLQPELFTFISRNIRIPPTEEFVEKQNAEQGLMPVIPDEAITYGYQAEDAHMVKSFINKKMPYETWRDGLLVVQLMMHSYLSAEKGVKVKFDPVQVEDYVPPVARLKKD